jgi:hypothetical protein
MAADLLASLLRTVTDLLAGPVRSLTELSEQPLELADQVVGLITPAGDQPADDLLSIAPRHAAPADGIVDHLLEAVTRDRDALLQGLAERLDALLGA